MEGRWDLGDEDLSEIESQQFAAEDDADADIDGVRQQDAAAMLEDVLKKSFLNFFFF